MALSDIMNMFRAPAPATQNNQVPQNGNPSQVNQPGQPLPGTQSSQNTAPNGVIPSQEQSAQTNPPAEVSPLDKHKDVWNTPTTDPKAPNPNESIFSNVDPAKVLESARKVDFAKTITPEQLQAIAAGGEGAVKALVESMNNVAQTVYANSTVATTKIVEQALEKQQEKFNASLPSLVKKLSVNEGLRTENPLLSNPAVQPLVEALATQYSQKNPNATTVEIRSQVTDYLESLGTVFAPKPAQSAQSKKAEKSTDWTAFLES